MKKVLVAMSGGVDSSTTAALLKSQGYEVCGITMKLLDSVETCSEESRTCCGFDASRDARMVADTLGIPHYTINAVEAFEKTVIKDFIDEYSAGRTPNPCVRCNYYLKFDFLMKKAWELGCEYLATGHYAVIENNELKRGKDELKDQSYFLYPVFASSFERILFPLGKYRKEEVRQIARSFNLPTASKRESQDICFIPDGNYSRFLDERGIESYGPGPILDISGKKIGTHNGIHNYTIGQRKGLGALGCRMFVKEIRVEDNAIVAATEEQLYSTRVLVKEFLHGKRIPKTGEKYLLQVRYRSKPAEATINSINENFADLSFDLPVKAVAPGQSAVLYDGETVVAGGVIAEVL